MSTLSIEKAVQQYLTVREQWKANRETELTAAFCAANDILFAAFACDWFGNESHMLFAYKHFRKEILGEYYGQKSPTHSFFFLPSYED
jgi:hypothetical protein